MVGAGVAPLAVDDHRAGLHEPADAGRRAGAQHHGGAEVVAGDVVVHVVDVDPEPHLRGQVDDRVHPGQRVAHRVTVAHVRDHELSTEPRQPAAGDRPAVAVDVGAQAVEDADLMALPRQRTDHRSPDEPGPSGDEDPVRHRLSPGVTTSTTRPPAALVRAASMTASTCTASRGSTGIPAWGSSLARASATSR